MTVCAAMVLSLLFGNSALAQLPSGPNVNNAWYQGTMEDVRIFYGYGSNSQHFHCRVDYYHDGRIRLLANESYYHVPNSALRVVTTWYFLQPPSGRESGDGKQLVRISYKTLGPPFKVEPVIVKEDLFTKHCVPFLGDLFRQIPAPESRMWVDQYGAVFGYDGHIPERK